MRPVFMGLPLENSMQFQDLKENFHEMDIDDRMKFFLMYITARETDLSVVTVKTKQGKKKGSKKKDKTVQVTPEQMKLLKSLGLI